MLGCMFKLLTHTHFFPACLVHAGEERFSPVGEIPVPRQTGEPRAGAQGKEAMTHWSILCMSL